MESKINSEKLPLIVLEDNEEFHGVISKLMAWQGYDTIAFVNPNEAKAYLNKIQRSILLIDYNLPEMTAKDFILSLNGKAGHHPFVVMTSHGDEKIAVEMMKLGATDYLVKDQKFLDLLPRIISNINEKIIAESKLKLSEQALKDSVEKYKMLFEHASDGIFIVNQQGFIIKANKAGCDLLGYSLDELSGINIQDIVVFDNDKQRQAYLKSLSIDQNIVAERNLRQKNGTVVSVEISSRLLPDDTVLSNVRDITRRKRAENMIRHMNKELELRVEERTSQLRKVLNELQAEISVRKQAEEKLILAKDEITKSYQREKIFNELKTRFITMISHEYRTPLTIISTSSYLIRKRFEQIESHKELSHMDKIQRAVESMTNLLEQVLTIDKLESDITKVEKSEIIVGQFIENVFSEIQAIDGFKHNFVFECIEKEKIIKSDRKLLHKILINILSNSAKYSPEGSDILIKMTIADDIINIKIADKGMGIPEKDLDLIFEPFHRGENIGAISGIGLGLTIVRQCIHALNGRINVSSKPNMGTAFFIEI